MGWSRTLIDPNAVKWSSYDFKNKMTICSGIVNGQLKQLRIMAYEDEIVFIDTETKKEAKVEKLMNVNNKFKPLGFMRDGES